MDADEKPPEDAHETAAPDPDIIEDIEIEDFAVDGICGVY